MWNLSAALMFGTISAQLESHVDCKSGVDADQALFGGAFNLRFPSMIIGPQLQSCSAYWNQYNCYEMATVAPTLFNDDSGSKAVIWLESCDEEDYSLKACMRAVQKEGREFTDPRVCTNGWGGGSNFCSIITFGDENISGSNVWEPELGCADGSAPVMAAAVALTAAIFAMV